MRTTLVKILFATAAGLLCSGVALAANGSGNVTLGYTYLDEEGNLGVNQETFNTYEGFGLSLNQWRYDFANGMMLDADLNNITLNNRNLRASIAKPGLFSLAVQNNQYTRAYDFNGSQYTRRRSTGAQASFQPHKVVKLFGGFGMTEKFGNSFAFYAPISDTAISTTDYKHTNFNFGAQGTLKQGYVRADYRHFGFDDKTAANRDRTADCYSALGSSISPVTTG